jgi:tetratricopeptide (TPR) repeat protein
MDFLIARRVPDHRIRLVNLGFSGKGSSFVAKRIAETLKYAPDAIVVLTGHNEFANPYFEDEVYFPAGGMHALASVRMLELFWARSVVRFRELRSDFDPHAPVNHRRRERHVRRFDENLDRIVRMAREAGVPLFLCTAPSNVLDWAPEYPSDEPRADRMPRSESDDPSMLYLSGTVRYYLGDFPAAKHRLTRARDLDPRPLRAITAFNHAIRTKAESEGVFLVDVARAFEDESAHGLAGFDLFADNVHPTPLGSFVLAGEVLTALSQHAVLPSAFTLRPGNNDFRAFMDSIGFFDAGTTHHADYLLQQSRTVLWSSSNRHRAARHHLDEALQRFPQDWRVWANASTVSFMTGRYERGRAELRQALELSGNHLRSNDMYVAYHDLMAAVEEACPGKTLEECAAGEAP